VLFDLDGVLVDSRPCIDRIWRKWAAARQLDAERFIRQAHGRRTSETLRSVAPELDIQAEVAALDAMEAIEIEGLGPTPGAASLLSALPRRYWAVVTSGSRAVASLRLRTSGLPLPDVFVTGEDVRQGKPAPEPYLLAASRLELSPADCLVVEDSPAGVAAARAAGMTVIAVLTTHPGSALRAAHGCIPGLECLTLRRHGTGLILNTSTQYLVS